MGVVKVVDDDIKSTDQAQTEVSKSSEISETIVAQANELKDEAEKVSSLQIQDVITVHDEDALPDVIIHATAIFKNCPHARLTQDDVESLGRLITCTYHLKRNIVRVYHDLVTYDGFNIDGTFNHQVQVRIEVRRVNLWEGARSYLWKHLGNDIWERSNGTVISLTRIHQK